MGLLAWVIMGLAIWHFTIWLPDRFWAGIVGAFLGAVIGAALFGLIIHGFSIPGAHATTILTALEGIPGALIGLAIVWAVMTALCGPIVPTIGLDSTVNDREDHENHDPPATAGSAASAAARDKTLHERTPHFRTLAARRIGIARYRSRGVAGVGRRFT